MTVQTTNNETKHHCYGIDILRLWMCLEVICNHYLPNETVNTFIGQFLCYFKQYAVPVFMTISFMVSSKYLSTSPKDRLLRLAFPQIVWTIIYLVLFSLLYFIGLINTKPTLTSFVSQLFLGHSYNAPMWFIVSQIYFTVIMTCVSKLSNRCLVIVCTLIFAASFTLQYSGMSNIFWSLGFETAYPCGRFFEMIPYVIVGYFFSRMGGVSFVKSYNILMLFLLAIILIVSSILNITPKADYGYSGINLWASSIMLTILFIILPIERENKFIKLIRKTASYTFGVYCAHVLIATCFIGSFPMKISQVELCCVIFIIGLVVSYIISKLPISNSRKLVQ